MVYQYNNINLAEASRNKNPSAQYLFTNSNIKHRVTITAIFPE